MGIETFDKIQKLKEICQCLRENKISFTLGGSGLLYFLGIVKSFNDWDLVLYCKESDLEHALAKYNLQKQICTPPYLSSYFYKMNVDGVSFDLMGYFGVAQQNERIELDYKIFKVEDTIPLGNPQDWMTSYRLMNRPHKYQLLKSYLEGLS